MKRSAFRRSMIATSLVLANAAMFPMAPVVHAQGSMVLEEIIVTARRRQESIQDVPIAMTAFSGDQLRESGITNIKDLPLQVPGLQIDQQSTSQIWIRGIGQRDDSARVDSPVGVYIDGVFIARKDAQLLDMLDPESVQVLRGPQGTLFGKNTTAGALVVNTRKPNENMGGYIEGRVGNYNRRDAKAVLNMPLVDNTLYSKITLGSVKRDGYQENIVTGQDMASEDRLSGALQLRWLPADNISVDTFLYYNKTREVQTGQNCKWLNNSSFGGQSALFQNTMWPGDTTAVWPLEGLGIDATTAGFLPGSAGSFNEVSQAYKDACDESYALLSKDKVAMDPKYAFNLNNLLAGVTVEWEINDNLSFKSITGYGDQRLSGISNNADNDGARGHFSSRYRVSPSDREQISQEFQFTGSAMDDRLQYTAGVFAMVEDIDDGTTYQFRGVGGLYIPAESLFGVPGAVDIVSISNPTTQLDTYELKNTTYAAFFQGSYDITHELQLTVGLRWTSEKRETRLTQRGLDVAAFNDTILTNLGPGFGGALFPTPQGGIAFVPAILPFDPLSQIQALFPFDEFGTIQYPLGPEQRYSANKTWTELSPMASLSYTLPYNMIQNTPLDNGMVYFTFSEGFKSGTFEPFGTSGLRPVDPETVRNYELGFKLDAFDRTLRLNVATYLMQYDDMQLRQVEFDPNTLAPVVVLANASKSEIRGIEAELTWQPLSGLLINAGASYNRYKFKDFDDVQFSTAALLTQQPLPAVDRSNETFPEVPKRTFNLGVQYSWVTDLGTIQPRVDYRYQSEIYLGLDPGAWSARSQSTVDSAHVVNARLGWISPNADWEVTAFATNLTNEKYFFGAAAVGDTVGTFTLQKAPPRMYGVELLYRFGTY